MASEPEVTIRAVRMAGEYELLRKLGTGGFGTVFEARHLGTDLTYAVKRIELSEEDAERFRKEALYPARIASQSLHVLSVHSFFQDQKEGLFYLVTELIPHGDLRRFLDDHPKPLPLRQGLELGLGIAKGLAAIHEQNIVHGDLKPANVLMDRKDAQWIPKIADFGLARSRASIEISNFASPGYAAPEQMDLLAERLPGPESDLFSFGMVLYELLTGQRRAPAMTLREYGQWLALCESGPQALTTEHRADNSGAPGAGPAAFSPMTLGEIRPELAQHPELEILVARLLEFDRRRRMASASDVVNTLVDVLRHIEREEALAVRAVVLEKYLPPAETRQVGSKSVTAERRPQKKTNARVWLTAAVIFVLGLAALAVVWNRNGGPLAKPAAGEPALPRAADSPPAIANEIGTTTPTTVAPSEPSTLQPPPASAEPPRAPNPQTTSRGSPRAGGPASDAATAECARLAERFLVGDLTEAERVLLKRCG